MRFSYILLLALPWLSLVAGGFVEECVEDEIGDVEECEKLNEIIESVSVQTSRRDKGPCSDDYNRAVDRCSRVPTCKPCIDAALLLSKRLRRANAVKGCVGGIVCGNTAIHTPFRRCKSAGEDLANCTLLFRPRTLDSKEL